MPESEPVDNEDVNAETDGPDAVDPAESEEQSIPVNGDSDAGSEEENEELTEVEQLEETVDTLKEERDELKEKYLRKAADMDNLKKRHEEEKQKIRKYANKDVLADLLEVLDNFNRALDSMEFESDEVRDGIHMIHRQLEDVLENHDAEPIDAEGEPFDPNVHEAMMQEEVEGLDQQVVLDVFKEGYRLNDQVLRPAQVKVGVPAEKPSGD